MFAIFCCTHRLHDYTCAAVPTCPHSFVLLFCYHHEGRSFCLFMSMCHRIHENFCRMSKPSFVWRDRAVFFSPRCLPTTKGMSSDEMLYHL